MNMRPLDKYLTNTPNGSYEKLNNDMKEHKCKMKKLEKINEIIKIKINKRNILIDELIVLLKSNSSKHKQFVKEKEIETIESFLSDSYLVKKKIILM